MIKTERLTMTSDKGGLAFAFNLDVTCKRSEMDKIVALGEHLKAYEDILFAPDGTERITVDRLRELVEAEVEGRIVILKEKKPLPEGCYLHLQAEYLRIGRCAIKNGICDGYAQRGEEPYEDCKECIYNIGYEPTEAALDALKDGAE